MRRLKDLKETLIPKSNPQKLYKLKISRLSKERVKERSKEIYNYLILASMALKMRKSQCKARKASLRKIKELILVFFNPMSLKKVVHKTIILLEHRSRSSLNKKLISIKDLHKIYHFPLTDQAH